MLGLGQDAVVAFPVEELAARGVAALVDWFSAVLSDDAARATWLGGVATLFGGSVQGTGAAAAVVVDLAPATLRISVAVVPGGAVGRRSPRRWR